MAILQGVEIKETCKKTGGLFFQEGETGLFWANGCRRKRPVLADVWECLAGKEVWKEYNEMKVPRLGQAMVECGINCLKSSMYPRALAQYFRASCLFRMWDRAAWAGSGSDVKEKVKDN